LKKKKTRNKLNIKFLISIIFIFIFITNIALVSNAIDSNVLSVTLSEGTENSATEEVEEEVDKLGIYSKAGILCDLNEDMILYDKHAYDQMYPASTTKIMTAILTIENCKMDEEVTISYYSVHSVPYSYSTGQLYADETLTVEVLLNALMIASANDAAYALAQYMANNNTNDYDTSSSADAKKEFDEDIATFADMMNQKASNLGCLNTHFVNPNGIHDDNHYSTAYDLYLMGKCAYSSPELCDIVKTKEYTIPASNKYDKTDRVHTNTNLLLNESRPGYYEYATGLKTGFTEDAQYCLVATASKGDRDLIAVVLYSETTKDKEKSREADVKKMFEYGFNEFEYNYVVEAGSVIQDITILNGTKETRNLNLLAKDDLKILLENNSIVDVARNVTIDINFAPISEGEKVGMLTCTIDDKEYQIDLIAEHSVEKDNQATTICIIAGAILLLILLCFLRRLFGSNKKKKRKKKRKSKHTIK